MKTHVFKLPSGVECEVKELMGKHQRMLTEHTNKNLSENLNDVLVDIIVRVGSKKNIDREFVLSMLSADRKKILVEVRQFTMDFEPTFEFVYEYLDSNGKHQEEELSIDISEGFPTKPLMVIDNDGVVEASYEEYDQIKREIELELPRSKDKIKFSLLDGKGERHAMTVAKSKRSSHTSIEMRNPRILKKSTKEGGDDIWIQANLDTFSFKDISYLRATIKEVEGAVDTEVMIEHPDAENREDKEVTVDLVSVLAFFFPSEAI